jgi:hypothetical protein
MEIYLHSFLTSTLDGGEWFVYYNITFLGMRSGRLSSSAVQPAARPENVARTIWTGRAVEKWRSAYWRTIGFADFRVETWTQNLPSATQLASSPPVSQSTLTASAVYLSRVYFHPSHPPSPTLLRADVKSIKGPEMFSATPESGATTSPPDVTHTHTHTNTHQPQKSNKSHKTFTNNCVRWSEIAAGRRRWGLRNAFRVLNSTSRFAEEK